MVKTTGFSDAPPVATRGMVSPEEYVTGVVGLREVDGLRSQRVGDDGTLHLRRGGVIGIAGLVGVDDEVADAGNGERAAGDAAGAGAAAVDGEDHRIARCAAGRGQRNVRPAA